MNKTTLSTFAALGCATLMTGCLFPRYTTIEEIPQLASQKGNDKGAFAFVIGFAIVMLMIFI